MKRNTKAMSSESMSCCGNCCMGVCPKCHAWMFLVIGIIFLINYYAQLADWWMLIGVLFVIKGILKLIMPYCSHCK